jgi:hypothetical protein
VRCLSDSVFATVMIVDTLRFLPAFMSPGDSESDNDEATKKGGRAGTLGRGNPADSDVTIGVIDARRCERRLEFSPRAATDRVFHDEGQTNSKFSRYKKKRQKRFLSNSDLPLFRREQRKILSQTNLS